MRQIHPDGGSTEELNPSLDEAMGVYDGVCWEVERILESERRENAKSASAPGLCFFTLRQEVVSVYPKAGGLSVCFEFPGSGKCFGIFSGKKRPKFLYVVKFPEVRLRELLGAHYEGEREFILELLLKYGRKVRRF